MVRSLAYLALFMFVGPALRAGELDDEFGSKTAPIPSAAIKTNDLASTTAAQPSVLDRAAKSEVTKASELDEESPTQSCCFRRRFGWGGWGGYGLGWGGWGGYGLGYGLGGFGLGYGLGWGGGWGGWGGGYGLGCFSPFMGYGYSGGWGYW